MSVHIVTAYAKNRVIGLSDTIPWRMRSDLVHLKDLTMGRVVILGRKTYESMAVYYDRSGRTMPGEKYIIITRDVDYAAVRPGVETAHSIESALGLAAMFSHDVYIIGGAQVYALSLPYADMLHVTEVDADIRGDTYFPTFNWDTFREVSREHHDKDENNQYNYSFVTYERL